MKIGALSGSITKTNVGSSYLVAGTNVTITSASNGSITISSTGGGTPGGADTEIQYNSAGSFTGSNNLKYEFSNNFLSFSGSFAQGDSNKATNSFSHAEGLNTWAAGEASHAEGEQTFAVGDYSHAEGYSTNAGGQYSHAEGYFTTGSGNYSHAEGYYTQASGHYSHAEGYYCSAQSDFSHAEGSGTYAAASYSHAEGLGTYANSSYSHAEGWSTTAGANCSHAEGQNSTAYGFAAHAEGLSCNSAAPYAHTEGAYSATYGAYSHAEGYNSLAFGESSHAEGMYTITSITGISAHSEGKTTSAQGPFSHTEGSGSITLLTGSHAEGLCTIASGNYQHVGGTYNLRDNDFSLFVIGNGSGDDNTLRSDIIRVNTDSVQITGSIIQSNSGSSTVGFMGNEVGSSPSSIGSDVFFYVSGSIGSDVAAFGGDLVVSGTISLGGDVLEVTGTISATQGFSGSLTTLVDGTSYLIAGTNITITSASNGSVTIDAVATSPGGSDTEIQYNSGGSFAGSSNFTYNGTAVILTGSFSQGYAAVASGTESHAEGFQTTASGDYSHAEGDGSVASGYASHAEGLTALAQGAYSHAEGNSTIALGIYSHAEGGTGGGGQLIASGAYSHAEGYNTIAYAAGTHAEGWSAKAGALGYYSTSISSGVITLDASYGDLTSTGIGTIVDGTYVVLNDYAYGNNYSSAIYKVDTSVYGTNTVLTLFDLSVSTTKAVIGVAGLATPTAADFPLGQFSHAEGYNTVAIGINSHAEGNGSTASSNFSHAEGEGTNTRGIASHAEGASVLALGDYSHAEGVGSHAFGYASHSEGLETIASGSYQHVGGQYNTRGNNFSLFVIGNGTSDLDADRSDILRVNTDSVQVSGSLIVSGAYIHNVVSGTTAPNYVVGTWDHVIVFSNNVVTATLPSAAPIGRKLIFKDGTGAASTAGGQMLSCSLGAIDGSSTYTMASVNYTAVSVIKINDPDEWIIV